MVTESILQVKVPLIDSYDTYIKWRNACIRERDVGLKRRRPFLDNGA
jgi:hypothetical protein